MSEPEKSLPRLSPQWTEDRSAQVRAALDQRAKRRRTLERTSIAALGIGALAGLFALVAPRVMLRPSAPAPSATAVASSNAARRPSEIETEDSTTLLDPNSEVVPEPEAKSRAFRLQKGAARFTVRHDAARPFRVKVGMAVVEDVGTVFTLRRLSEKLAEVSVQEGRVRVSSAGASFDLGAGERRQFATDVADVEAANSALESEPRARIAAVAPWRPLAENGRFGEAYAAMKTTGASSVRDETEELLLAADVARMSGHPAEAVPYLERLLRSRGSDPRAGLAAFTLGRVLLDELGRPSEAAAAFKRARASGGPLAEDALAREVEALSRGGDTAAARALALEYKAQYPNGRRTRRVVKFGGLD